MSQLIVNVNKLNKRKQVPVSFPEKENIIGTVHKGFRFEGVEERTNALGKWYKDRDDAFYWGGGLTILDEPPTISIKIKDLPANLPEDYRAGIDISHHNSLPDWAAIKTAGVSFVYHKISEGVGTPDVKAKANCEMAHKLSFKIGYYHFCRPDTRNGGTVEGDATAEASEAIKRMDGLPKPDMPLVLDLEDQPGWDTKLDRNNYLLWINTFINRIKDNGIEPMIYSRKEYLDRKLPANHELGQYKLWISFYPKHPDARNVKCPVGWSDWAMWQYTEHGILGNNSKLDINVLKDKSMF